LKSSVVLLFISCLFFSCKKSSPVNPNNGTGAQIASLKVYNAADHIIGIDTLIYNSDGNLVGYKSWTIDSTNGPVITDSASYSFAWTSGATGPASYTVSSLVNGGFPAPMETHQLYYDNQNRIIKDSLMSGGDGSRIVALYGYNGNLLTIDLFSNTGSYLEYEKDTLSISGSNISKLSNHWDLSSNQFTTYQQYTYGNSPNPLYNKALSNALGALLYDVLRGDFISTQLVTVIQAQDVSDGSTYTEDYQWTLDSKGRVVSGHDNTNQFFYSFFYE
jgi:hypothetical protein